MLTSIRKTTSFLTTSIALMMSCFCMNTGVEAQSITTLIKGSGIEIQEVSGIDITFPQRASPNASQNITELQYWLKKIPYQEDTTAAGYVVYPKLGVIIPLVWPNENDLEKIKVGELFDHYKYLEEGALHYVGNAPDQNIGNMVLAAHSSFAKTDAGRYKTVGQIAPLSTPGDKIFLYLADETGKYTLYVYTIKRSEEIPETEVSILNQNVTEKTLTFFTCYPIGTTDARWVNQAVLTDTISSDKRTAPTEAAEPVSFTTQAVPKKELITKKKATTPKQNPATQEHGAAPLSGEATQSSVLTPTFKERVVYRPIAYSTAIKLVSTVGFKRSNLEKLTMLIDQKVEKLTSQSSLNEANKKRAIIFMLIKELIEGFMK